MEHDFVFCQPLSGIAKAPKPSLETESVELGRIKEEAGRQEAGDLSFVSGHTHQGRPPRRPH